MKRHGRVLRIGTAKGTLWTPLKRRSPRRGIGMVGFQRGIGRYVRDRAGCPIGRPALRL